MMMMMIMMPTLPYSSVKSITVVVSQETGRLRNNAYTQYRVTMMMIREWRHRRHHQRQQ